MTKILNFISYKLTLINNRNKNYKIYILDLYLTQDLSYQIGFNSKFKRKLVYFWQKFWFQLHVILHL